MSDLQERLHQVQGQIAQACLAAERSTDEVKLIVVTKNHPAQLVLELLDLGHRDFGENRNQEVEPKAQEVSEKTSVAREDFRWHFVGQLQTNKVKNVLGYADVLHSLDRESLLQTLAKELPKQDRTLDSFIQLNLTDDPGRGGIQPGELVSFAEQVLEVKQLNLLGVMGVASLDGSVDADFESIRQASLQLQQLAPSAKFISAGMSDDFEIAIRHGATHLRIGTAITGKRQY